MTEEDEISAGLTELRDMVRDTLPRVKALAAERDELRERLKSAEQDVTDAKMQRDVFCEKLNEYIEKTKEAEKRAETAEQEVERLKDALVFAEEASEQAGVRADNAELESAEVEAKLTDQIEQARAEAYERGKAERIGPGCPHIFCNECAVNQLAGYNFEDPKDADP